MPKGSESLLIVANSLWPHVHVTIYSPWSSLGRHTGMGRCSLLQAIFPTQGLNPGLPHCRWILYKVNHQGSPRILEWVAYPFSGESFRPKNLTGISCIEGRFFTSWATKEVLRMPKVASKPPEARRQLWSRRSFTTFRSNQPHHHLNLRLPVSRTVK